MRGSDNRLAVPPPPSNIPLWGATRDQISPSRSDPDRGLSQVIAACPELCKGVPIESGLCCWDHPFGSLSAFR